MAASHLVANGDHALGGNVDLDHLLDTAWQFIASLETVELAILLVDQGNQSLQHRPGGVHLTEVEQHDAEGPQNVRQFAGALETVLGAFFQTTGNDPIERRRPLLSRLAESGRLFVEDGDHRVRAGAALERPAAGDHLVQHTAEREDVAARVGGQAAGLLRGHVEDRT